MNYKELEKYIRQLFNRYLNKYNLSPDDKNDVIQDTMLKLYIKEQDGTLNGSVEDNKNYIFITLRNFVFQAGNRKKVIHDPIDVVDFVSSGKHNTPSTIEDELTNETLSLQVKECVKSKRFTDDERIIINGMLEGYSYTDMRIKLGYNSEDQRYGLSWVKDKIKDELFPTYKYLVITDSFSYGFRNKVSMLKHLGMSVEQFNNYKRLGKTKFPKYQIIIL